ncbi:small ribosomal subunit protein mS47 [Trichomonascus vanleenenianus]|uniref:enoyl-CoA hydratase/isomerase family protein n=1 Tax=Trichomonascus vanleenenianus TaxID=2268995 RepID=UPI003ECB2AEB
MQSLKRASALLNTVKAMPLRSKITNPTFLRMSSTASTAPEVKFHANKAGRTITLNRPAKLNSLNLNMVEEILPRLREWAKSDSAKIVMLKGEGEKSLCAGGDVAALAGGIAKEGAKGSAEAAHYFNREYTLDQYIATYPKPFVSFMDGITMGGGVGLSVHAPFRVATEKTLFAMPETTIGFFPDVGGTYFLSRLDGQLGVYLGLTSERLKGFDAVYAGIATHYVPSSRLADLEARLSELHNSVAEAQVDSYQLVNEAIEDFAEDAPADYAFSISGEKREVIDECFGHDSVEEILRALDEHPSEFARKTKATILERSPTAVKVTLAAIRNARKLDISAAFTKEYHIAENFMYHPDFVEGVSALLLTKPKRAPSWTPPSSGEVSQADVAAFFQKRDSGSPEIEFLSDETFTEYPHSFGLPKEAEVQDYVIGNHSTREFKATRDEVLTHFQDRYGAKNSVEIKVREILTRMTKPDPSDESLLDWKY